MTLWTPSVKRWGATLDYWSTCPMSPIHGCSDLELLSSYHSQLYRPHNQIFCSRYESIYIADLQVKICKKTSKLLILPLVMPSSTYFSEMRKLFYYSCVSNFSACKIDQNTTEYFCHICLSLVLAFSIKESKTCLMSPWMNDDDPNSGEKSDMAASWLRTDDNTMQS